MIKPEKYLNLNLSVLEISALIIKYLRKNNYLYYSEMIDRLIKTKGENAKEVILPSLNLLFALGKIEYIEKIDSLRLIT